MRPVAAPDCPKMAKSISRPRNETTIRSVVPLVPSEARFCGEKVIRIWKVTLGTGPNI